MSPLFSRKRYKGTISSGPHSGSCSFAAWVDECGSLKLDFDPLEVTIDFVELMKKYVNADDIAHSFSLRGVSTDDCRISSDRFYISSLSLSNGGISGHCLDADISGELPAETETPKVSWYFRHLKGLNLFSANELADVSLLASMKTSTDQEISAILTLSWHGEKYSLVRANDLLGHVARILSLADGIFLRPSVIEERRGNIFVAKLTEWPEVSRDAAPSVERLDRGAIFDRACRSFSTTFDQIHRLGPAIQWVLLPSHTSELKLIAAMTALEYLLTIDDTVISENVNSKSFKKISKALRGELRRQNAPEEMFLRIPELNKVPLKTKLDRLINNRRISLTNIPVDWRDMIVKTRNNIIHTGLSRLEPEEDNVYQRARIARELVIRAIFSVLEYEGSYVLQTAPLRIATFPSCEFR